MDETNRQKMITWCEEQIHRLALKMAQEDQQTVHIGDPYGWRPGIEILALQAHLDYLTRQK